VTEAVQNPVIDEINSMKERMETLYSKSFSENEGDASSPMSAPRSAWRPAIDILETDEEWVLLADLPGVRDEDLHLEVKDNRLTIEGKRAGNINPTGFRRVIAEREEGGFRRSFTLPPSIKADAIAAELKRGVLTVTIPKGRLSSQRVKIRLDQS
jgi:HSP20 family protein